MGERDGFTKTTLQHTAHNSAEPREGEIKPKLRDSGARLLTFLSSNRMCNQITELLEQNAPRFRRRDINDRWDDQLMTKKRRPQSQFMLLRLEKFDDSSL